MVLLITAGATLAVADAVKYATALFTPVVVIVVALAVWRQHGGGAGLVAGLAVLVLLARAGHRGHRRWRPGILAGHHDEHP